MSAKRPPIEPLSRPAWDRVEAGVFARLERGEHLLPGVDAPAPQSPRGIDGSNIRSSSIPSSRLPSHLLRGRSAWWLAAAFAAAASFALWWRVGADESVAPVAQTSQEAAPVAPTHEARIATTDAPTQTTLGESVVVLAAHSDVNVSGSDAAGWRVRVEAGQVDCQVAPRRGRPPFVVQAGATQVTVVGTRFSVTRAGVEARVSVTEGHVQVDSGDAHVLLGPGESWPKLEPSAEPAAAPEDDAEVETRGAGKARAPARQRFDRAARLESKNPRAALALYHDLARGKGAWAANALYAEARLELELGHDRRAERLLRQYLVRHPQGLNTADVRKLLERVAP